MRRTTWIVGVVVACLGPAAQFAVAHGPCGCTGPAFTGENTAIGASPGDKLLVAQPAVEILWNPQPEELRIGAFPAIAEDYVPGVETLVLVPRREKAKKRVVTVPDVPDGRYLMVIYDMSEGGNHYTWDHVNVMATETAATSDDPNDEGTKPAWIAIAAVAGLVGGLAFGRWRWRRGDG